MEEKHIHGAWAGNGGCLRGKLLRMGNMVDDRNRGGDEKEERQPEEESKKGATERGGEKARQAEDRQERTVEAGSGEARAWWARASSNGARAHA